MFSLISNGTKSSQPKHYFLRWKTAIVLFKGKKKEKDTNKKRKNEKKIRKKR